MNTIEIKDRKTKKVIYSHTCEKNSMKITVEKAVEKEISLSDVDLSDIDLIYADLRDADLSYADLRDVDLSYADLRNANLSHADLSRANLNGTNLRNANLSNVNLSKARTEKRYLQVGCIGSEKRLTTYCFDDDIVWCGCFRGNLEKFEEKVNETHADNPQYLAEYEGLINYIKFLKNVE